MRDFHRKKLNKLLGRAGNKEFIQLLWATHAIQSDYSEVGQKFFAAGTVPKEAVTTDLTSSSFVQKWEIETLANELLTTPKVGASKNGVTRTLRWDHFGASVDCVNRLRQLESAEYKKFNEPRDILVEMGRIAARQFGWQRGFINISQFYRNAYVYGQGACADYFEERYGISPNRFSMIGFMLYVFLTNAPVATNDGSWEKLGVSWAEVELVLSMIALPFAEAAKLALTARASVIQTAYRPSIYRQFPCLRFGERSERIRAPLPELILERITSGVYYDVVEGEGKVRDDYGRRFEDYCSSYLSRMLPDLNWYREFTYRVNRNTHLTPDIICSTSGGASIAIECKATRMSHEAMFGANPMIARGYEDITKAVFQLWRFFSHCRRGYIDQGAATDAVGVVLTLDNWLVMSDPLRKKVLEDAANMAHERDLQITEEDKRPIVFLAITELEIILRTASQYSFTSALIQANSEKYNGWRLDTIHNDMLRGTNKVLHPYPFKSDLGNLLPWWDEFGEKLGGNNISEAAEGGNDASKDPQPLTNP